MSVLSVLVRVFQGHKPIRRATFRSFRPDQPLAIRVGRDESQELRLEAPTIQIRHALIQISPSGAISIEPSSPGAMILLGDQAVTASQPLRPGQEVRLGETRLTIDIVPPWSSLRHSLRGLQTCMAWRPDGKQLLTGSNTGSLFLWDARTGKRLKSLLGHEQRTTCVAWSRDMRTVATAAEDMRICLWDAEAWELRAQIHWLSGSVLCLAWSADSQALAFGTEDRTLQIFEAHRDSQRLILPCAEAIHDLCWSPFTYDRQLAYGSADGKVYLYSYDRRSDPCRLVGHDGRVQSVIWSPDGEKIVSGSEDMTIRIWDVQTGRQEVELEGHSDAVGGLAFSPGGGLLASRSLDEVRLWRCETWAELTAQRALREPNRARAPQDPIAHAIAYQRIAFRPQGKRQEKNQPPQLAVLAETEEEEGAVHVWQVEEDDLLGLAVSDAVRYTNAKVILVGDTGVGKSSLRMQLTEGKYEPLDSTHNRRAYCLEIRPAPLPDGNVETREVLLWDLAGQPGYRLIHQLHLCEVSVAVFVIDARSIDPFSVVRYWDRSLRMAQKVEGETGLGATKILVAARIDRGGLGLDMGQIRQHLQTYQFVDYIATSARENIGISDLRQAILEAIRWDALPWVSSNKFFQEIKLFLLQKREDKQLLVTEADLYAEFVQRWGGRVDSRDLAGRFRTCIRLLQSRDLLYRFSFGDYVLIQPELRDDYASALINAVKEERDGLGSIEEDRVLEGRFLRPRDRETKLDPAMERLLLIEMLRELVEHQLVLREERKGQSALLIFPTQLTREKPNLEEPDGKALSFFFEGPALNTYAVLVVRLASSGLFRKKNIWKNAVVYEAPSRGQCGLSLRELGEGDAGEIAVFFDRGVKPEERTAFEAYVYKHLRCCNLEGLRLRRVFTCPVCGVSPSTEAVARRRERGLDWIACNVCLDGADTTVKIPIQDDDSYDFEAIAKTVSGIDRAADERREREANTIATVGKRTLRVYDVLFAFGAQDRAFVETTARQLVHRFINPWIGSEQGETGALLPRLIERAMADKVKSAAFFFGAQRPPVAHEAELVAGIRALSQKVPVVLVSLPGRTAALPALPPDIRAGSVAFEGRPDDVEALDQLECLLTGKALPTRLRSSSSSAPPLARAEVSGLTPFHHLPPSVWAGEESTVTPSKRRPLTILHLSDLHVPEDADPQALVQPLLADLRDADEGLGLDRLDYLVVTGDISNRATPREFDQARKFISELCADMAIDLDRCILVPGNHDLSWDEDVYTYQPGRKVREEALAPGSYVKKGDGFLVRDEVRYPQRFRGFAEHLHRPLLDRPFPSPPEEQYGLSFYPEHGLLFYAFNSCWEIDEHFPDRSSVHLGAVTRCLGEARQQVDRARREGRLAEDEKLVRIAAWHHPISGNEKIKDDAFLDQLRRDDVWICLHGHIHEERADLIGYLHPTRRIHVVGSGSFGAPARHRPESAPRLYNVLSLSADRERIRVHTRAMPKAGAAWRGWAVWPGERKGERRDHYDISLT